jgi:ubiquinone/menaquinone biosynthesis C-methylase UbiE
MQSSGRGAGNNRKKLLGDMVSPCFVATALPQRRAGTQFNIPPCPIMITPGSDAALPAHKAAIRNMYDKRAPFYHARAVDGYHGELRDLLLASSPLWRGANVLDLCAGTGVVALKAAQKVGPTGKVVAVDFADDMLGVAREEAHKHGLANLTFVLGDVEDAAVLDTAVSEIDGNGFDAIFCSAAAVWFDSIENALSLWRRVVRPGGSVAFNGWSENSFVSGSILQDVAWERGLMQIPNRHKPTATLEECEHLLENAGWEVASVIETDMSSRKNPLALKNGFDAMLANMPSKRSGAPYLVNLLDDEQVVTLRNAYMRRVDELTSSEGFVRDEILTRTIVGRCPP